MLRGSLELEGITKHSCLLLFCPLKGTAEAPSAVGLPSFPLAMSTSLGSHWGDQAASKRAYQSGYAPLLEQFRRDPQMLD